MHKIKLSRHALIFYYEWLIHPDSGRYNISIDQTLYGDLNVERLRAALKKYVAEHLVLNSHIKDVKSVPYWVPNKDIRELEYVEDANSVSKSELLDYVGHSFDLYSEPLYRFKLLRIQDGIYRLIIVMHHLVIDGTVSLDTGVFAAIANYYNDENYACTRSIEEQKKLLKKLAVTISHKLEKDKEKYKEFWRTKLSDIEPIDLRFLQLSKDYDEHGEQKPASIAAQEEIQDQGEKPRLDNQIGEIHFAYEGTELTKLRQIKNKYAISPYVYGLNIFALLLYKYTNNPERLAISYPIAIKEGLDFIYGAQLNTNLIPYQFSKATTIVDLFKQTQEFFKLTTRDEIKYGYYPIANIIQECGNKHLLDTCFAQTFFREKPFAFNGITKVATHTELSCDGVAENFLLFEYDGRNNDNSDNNSNSGVNKINYRVRHDKNTINTALLSNFVTTYKRLFLEVLEDLITGQEDKLISSYNLLDAEQYQKIVYEYNRTDVDYPRDKTIHALFEEQVKKYPHNIAVVYEDIKLTYQELNTRANQLAYFLRNNYAIQPDDLVVLCLDRNEHALIAMLATLKSGGAYVPIDPKHPDDRLGYIFGDTQAKVILTNATQQERVEKIVGKIAETENVRIEQLAAEQHATASCATEQHITDQQMNNRIDVIAIDSAETKTKLNTQKNTNPHTSTTSSNLMYVIYTSGTTGNPKGVAVEHRSVVNYANYLMNYNQLNNRSAVSQYASLSFDAAVPEIYPAILVGGTLCIAHDQSKLSPIEIDTFFNKNNIAYAFLPTKFAESFFYYKNESLANLLVAGDKLEKFVRQQYRVTNGYGPTECTVHATSFVVEKLYNNIPIGKPINNVKCYVLDSNLNALPIGAIGELGIGGESLARGYLHCANLTAEKFIANPFQTQAEKIQGKNSRLYKTGDLVRMLPNGNLEYIGRNDSQVKIRGFRIELGEIERHLLQYPPVQQAVVIVQEHVIAQNNTDKYLAAYYVATQQTNIADIKNYLATKLPEYMVPSAIMQLNTLPVTVNGKLDKKALPVPQCVEINNNICVTLENEQRQLVCAAFAQILGVKNIGIDDDFFTYGGNSILAMQLVATLQTNFDIKVADIFNLRTPAKIAANVYCGKNVFQQKLEQIKLAYQRRKHKKETIDQQLQNKLDNYLKNATNLPWNFSLYKKITNVLLTGATGYLGCNLLYQLLHLTRYNIFVLVRAHSQQEAWERLKQKFQFYFDKTLDDVYNKRIFVVASDIVDNHLGLSPQQYQDLAKKIDSVIHAAALVKHYGNYADFYAVNVQATINLLEFTKLTTTKDFHYISTYSVLNCGFIPNCAEYIYTEDDFPDNLQLWDNVYVQTKLQGEHEVIKYRADGINGNIYRVGNLAFIAMNGRAQENVEDNAFFHWLQCLFKMRCVAQDLNRVEVSPVDMTAQAIVQLFDKEQLTNSIYHVFNSKLFNLSKIFAESKKFFIATLPMNKFVDNITRNFSNNIYHDLILRFLLHQGWLDGYNISNTTSIKVLQNRTQHILQQLGFTWERSLGKTFNKYIEKLCGDNEMQKKSKILIHLEMIARFLPTPVYWLDVNQKYLGINDLVIKGTGTLSFEKDFAGKTPYDLYPQEMAEEIVQHHKEVIRTGKIFSAEESIKDITTGELKHFNATIAPLHDDNGKVIGTIGISIDITAEKKEAEKTKKAKVFEHLQRVAEILPTPFYWLGLNQEYLGINDLVVQGTGTRSYVLDFAGKTPYDVYPKHMAENIVQHHQEVIRTGKTLCVEESIKVVTSDEIKHFNATIAPLYDDDKKIIGTIGTSIDITAEKKEAERLKKIRVFEHLERVAQIVPAPFYWLGLNQEYLGLNSRCFAISGTSSFDKDFAGKTPYDLYPKHMAEDIVQHHKDVIRTKKMLSAEESIKDLTTGQTRYFNAFIAPLCDDDGIPLGTIGISIETTAEKEAHRLQLENESQKAALQEQEKFKKTADQVAHDIRSPLTSLAMILQSCAKSIPEDVRVALRNSAVNIGDIANHLLSQYKQDDTKKPIEDETRQPIMVSLALSQVLTSKKYQYKHLPINFDYIVCQSCHFSFINAEPTSFIRMISNLINNAVDSLEGKQGHITLTCDANDKRVAITIQDNGKGIPQEIATKIMGNIPITNGKKDGHGIGMMQVQGMLQRNDGKLIIDSQLGKGTKMTVIFPAISSPDWIAKEVKLCKGDTVVVLDDDSSIHGAWQTRFKDYEEEVSVKHFTEGNETVDFINTFPEKHKIFLLTDFELLQQELNGLHVIERTGIARSLLVTSHYANNVVLDLAIKSGTKILPKQLAPEVPIEIRERDDGENSEVREVETKTAATKTATTETAKTVSAVVQVTDETQRVDIVIIEDSKMLADALAQILANHGKNVDKYYHPKHFLAKLEQYPKDTKICMDNGLDNNITGLMLAQQLHEAGYTHLYLFSGKEFERSEIPEYLTLITKPNSDMLLEHLLG